MEKKTISSNFHGIGRRKSAIARVWLKKGTGKISVNGKDYNKYFDTNLTRKKVIFPFQVLGVEKNFDTAVNVSGGGIGGQADAVKLGISRALLSSDNNYKNSLRKYNLLTVDARNKERKKYGQKGARRKFQFVKR